MLHNRVWTDPAAEAEFWKQMAEYERLTLRLQSKGGLFGRFGRAALVRDLDLARGRSEALVRDHTIALAMPHASEASLPVERAENPANASLKRLAGFYVSLPQDRAPEGDRSEQSSL